MEDYTNIVQMYATENIATLTDADIQTLPELAHVTVAELTAAKNGMDSLVTAMGGYTTGSVATRMAKIVKNLP
jgi:predicted TIM-barrel enzyme